MTRLLGRPPLMHAAFTMKEVEDGTFTAPLEAFGTQPGTFQATPLMIDDVLYLSTPYNRVVALDARTGTELWRYDPKAYEDGQPPNGTGFVHRGVAAWRDPAGARRIFMNSRYRLIALDAKSGRPVPGFGRDGIVDLTNGLSRAVNPRHYTNTSPPVVYRDLVILGNGVGDRLVYTGDPPGDVRAFDARTGAIVWTFRPVPAPGEFGHETWGRGSWKTTGHTNVWAPMSVDEARGLLYLPVSTPSNDFYGARRPGANLFAESIVCLDAATGVRRSCATLSVTSLRPCKSCSMRSSMALRLVASASNSSLRLVTGTRSERLPDMILVEVEVMAFIGCSSGSTVRWL